MKDLTSEFKSLAKAMNARNLCELKEKQEKRSERSTKKFDKMSSIKKNTIIMFQVGPHHDQQDVNNMKPTENMLIAMNQGTPADVVGLLRSHSARRGIMATFESGLGAAIRDGNLASSPRPMDVNNLTIFLIHPGAKAQAISARDTLLYQMKAELGKLEQDDVEALTSMKPFAPFDFASFLHMLKGMEFVCEFLGGPNCYSALAWRHAREHAEFNEYIYVDKAGENAMFFASVANDYHRRHQTFIHSLEFKNMDEMARDHMNFSNVTDRIDTFEYVIHRPTFIPKKRPQDREQKDQKEQKPGAGGGDRYKRRRFDDKKTGPPRETMNNPKHNSDLKIPDGVKFGDLFQPDNREGIEGVPHPDGTLKCNNWHYRDWCKKEGCKFEKSYDKELTGEEITKGKKYKEALYEKFKKNGEKS